MKRDVDTSMIGRLFINNKRVILYGVAMAVLLLLLKWMEYRFVVMEHSLEIYIGAIALLFMGLGIWLALKLARPKTLVVEKEVVVEKQVFVKTSTFVVNEAEIKELGLSKRELEVLQLMAEGLSNNEIAGRLFVSLNTVKTHSSKIFEKLGVERRTQAVEKAKRLNIIV